MSTYGDLIKQSKLIVNCGYDGDKGEKAVDGGKVEAVVFGQAFISNPDYFRRLEEQLPLNEADFTVSSEAHRTPIITHSPRPFTHSKTVSPERGTTITPLYKKQRSR